MGIRGHIQTTQTSYEGVACISTWKSNALQKLLENHEIGVEEMCDGNQWGIWIDEKLRNLTKELLENKHNDEINNYMMEDDLKSPENAKVLGEFLQTGIEVADKKNYHDIIIDWF